MKTNRQIMHEYFHQLIVHLAQHAKCALKYDDEGMIKTVVDIQILGDRVIKQIRQQK